jgi:predicted secreted Zn-dependent protease
VGDLRLVTETDALARDVAELEERHRAHVAELTESLQRAEAERDTARAEAAELARVNATLCADLARHEENAMRWQAERDAHARDPRSPQLSGTATFSP